VSLVSTLAAGLPQITMKGVTIFPDVAYIIYVVVCYHRCRRPVWVLSDDKWKNKVTHYSLHQAGREERVELGERARGWTRSRSIDDEAQATFPSTPHGADLARLSNEVRIDDYPIAGALVPREGGLRCRCCSAFAQVHGTPCVKSRRLRG